jgi:translation initiation factor 3 subunit J
MAEQLGTNGAGGSAHHELDEMSTSAKSKADFEALAAALCTHFADRHKDSKQYKAFVKVLAKGLCAHLDKDGVKDVETALAGLRSEKVKAELKAAAEAKKGG